MFWIVAVGLGVTLVGILGLFYVSFRNRANDPYEEPDDSIDLIVTVYVCKKCRSSTHQVYGHPPPTQCTNCKAAFR